MPPRDEDRAAIEAAVDELDALHDAVGDLLLAESVHQVIGGDLVRAGVTLDAIQRGTPPPKQFDVIATPRPGTTLPHRLVASCGAAGPARGWPRGPAHGRGATARVLERWVARWLGDPTQVRAFVTWPGTSARIELALAELELGALDLVAAAGTADGLTPWLRYHADRKRPDDVPAETAPIIDSGAIAEVVAVARALGRLLGYARGLLPDELADDAAIEPIESAPPPALAAAITALRVAADRALAAVAGDDRRKALLTLAGFGIAAVPATAHGDVDGLVSLARAAASEARGRADAAEAPDITARERWRRLFGEAMPWLFPLDAATIRALPTTSDRATRRRDRALLRRVGLVRAGAGAADAALVTAAALGTINGLPICSGPLAERGTMIAIAIDDAPPVAAIAIDDWTETVPAPSAITGLALHHDRPNAQAPQCILLAVTPKDSWTLDDLVATVRETLGLAAIRMLPPAAVAAIHPALPAVWLAVNPTGDAIGVDLT
jgi:hypothetical protein